MRILIVEDEAKAGDALRRGLEEAGHAVSLARDGADGLRQALEAEHDVVVLDLMLPRLDGWGVLGGLRAQKDVPVLLLSARDEVADRVRGLESGADDYLVKPFAFPELLARLQTIVRRGPLRDPERIQVGDLEIDLPNHRVTRAGRRIDLKPREFDLLRLLARRPGAVLSRARIAAQVWNQEAGADLDAVDAAIRRLRAKVDAPWPDKLIHTMHGFGYLVEARAWPAARDDCTIPA